ncbi:hypothetical protein [Legionella bononiensis]|uniref:hypothetical protein n=1 Tax=Legionella bononiensis TaxID=2793102 RepID=UPI0019343724|nr:hypothetical protein [Legionella bononiensis]
MPVIFLSENVQASLLESHNKGKRRFEKIPLIQRNSTTGWPLLQVSLFSPSTNDTQRYEHALGGGKCHFFYIGAFNLACALAKIPGPMEITAGYGQTAKREQLIADNVGLFLDSFSIKHQGINTTIASDSGAYGKTLTVQCPEGDSSKLQFALFDVFRFAVKKGSTISDIGLWKDVPGYTEREIRENINDDVAVFAEGQIFVDLGEFLEQQVKDKDITEFFKHLFKVDEFLALNEQHLALENPSPVVQVNDVVGPKLTEPDLKPIPSIVQRGEVPESQRSHHDLAESHRDVSNQPGVRKNEGIAFDDLKSTNIHLKNIYFQIKIMRDYGISLTSNDLDKGKEVQSLANALETKLDDFYKNSLNKKPDEQELLKFKADFKVLLNSKNDLMREHREIWKPIVANILISLTGIGLLALAGHALYQAAKSWNKNEKITVNKLMFFGKTESEKKVEDIEQAIESAPSDINKIK